MLNHLKGRINALYLSIALVQQFSTSRDLDCLAILDVAVQRRQALFYTSQNALPAPLLRKITKESISLKRIMMCNNADDLISVQPNLENLPCDSLHSLGQLT